MRQSSSIIDLLTSRNNIYIIYFSYTNNFPEVNSTALFSKREEGKTLSYLIQVLSCKYRNMQISTNTLTDNFY